MILRRRVMLGSGDNYKLIHVDLYSTIYEPYDTYNYMVTRQGYGIIKSETDHTLIGEFRFNGGVGNITTVDPDSVEYELMGISNRTWEADPFISFALTKSYNNQVTFYPHRIVIEFVHWNGVDVPKVTNAIWWQADIGYNVYLEKSGNDNYLSLEFQETFQSVQSPGTLKLGDLVFDLDGVTQEEQFQWLI